MSEHPRFFEHLLEFCSDFEQGFSFCVVLCAHEGQQSYWLQRLSEALAQSDIQLVTLKGKALSQLDPAFRLTAHFQQPLMQHQRAVLSLSHAESVFQRQTVVAGGQRVSRFLARLNIDRDDFVAHLKRPMLLWLTHESRRAMGLDAPDFYDFRDLVLVAPAAETPWLVGTAGLTHVHIAEQAQPVSQQLPEDVDALLASWQTQEDPSVQLATYNQLANRLFVAGRLPEARKVYDAAFARIGTHIEEQGLLPAKIMHNRGRALHALGYWDQAEASLQAGLAALQSFTTGQTERDALEKGLEQALADLHLDRGLVSAAEEQLIDHQDNACYHRANLAMAAGNLTLAEALWLEASKGPAFQAPQQAAIWYSLGLLRQRGYNFAGAEQAWQAALGLFDEDQVPDWLQRGVKLRRKMFVDVQR